MSSSKRLTLPKTLSPISAPVRPRTRSSVTIRHLPPELLTCIFKGMHIWDLLSLKKVCKSFNELADVDSLWMHASFSKVWPSTERILHFFVKAASHGNFEALIKLAFSRLYNERLPAREKQLSLEEQAKQAARYFYEAEQLSSVTFTWVFLRPPWATQVPCCKYYVCQAMVEYAQQEKLQKCGGSIAMCLGHTMQLMDNREEAVSYIEQAAKLGLHEAQFYSWMNKYSKELVTGFSEFGRELEAVRQLRSLSGQKRDVWTELILCRCYVKGMLGGLDWSQAVATFRALFQSSRAVNVEPVLSFPHEVNSDTRYILTDWLAEVATNLNMGTEMLLNTVGIVDRCLLARSFRRGEIQLLGVSALLITSRYMSKEILTIREAAWYTDNTYTYENVVEMAGDIISILKGSIRQVTSYDMRVVLEPVCGLGAYGLRLLDYMAELCMLQAHMTAYSPATMATSSILLARILLNFSEAWPSKLEELTGFTLEDLTPCVLSINKCLVDDVHYDSQNSPMQAVKLRFSGEDCPCDVTEIKHVSDEELRDKLGVISPKERRSRSRPRLRQAQKLICSPSRGKHRTRRMSTLERPGREDASTPPLDLDSSGYDYDADNDEDSDPFDLNESFCSIQSESTESEPRTDPFLEMSSEPDIVLPGGSSSSPPSFISGCSELPKSFPFGITINISNFSFSTSSSSGIGSCNSSTSSKTVSAAAKLAAVAQPLAHQEHSFSDDDNHSLGFSCAKEISSVDDDDDTLNRSEGNSSALLPFPVMESSESVSKFYDPGDWDGWDDYGILNEAFCEQSFDLIAHLPDSSDSCNQTSDISTLRKSESGQNQESVCSTLTKRSSQSSQGHVQSCDGNADIDTTDAQKGLMSKEGLLAGSEAQRRTNSTTGFVPLVKNCRPSTETSSDDHIGCSLAICDVDQEHGGVLGRDSVTARRQSLRSSTKTSVLLGASSTSPFSQCRIGVCEDQIHSGLRKRRACSDGIVVTYGSQKKRRDECSPPATQRKSPRTPVPVSSPHSTQTKRQRRYSACYTNNSI